MKSDPARIHLLPLCLLFLIFAAHAAFAADVYHVRGEGAFAIFTSWDASGCISTTVNIDSSEGVVRWPDNDRVPSAYVGVWLYAEDRCDGWRTVMSGYASRTLEPGTLVVGSNLAHAALATEIAVYDRIGGTTRIIAFDLTWKGTGDLRTGKVRESYRAPGIHYVDLSFSSSRSAEAAGTVLLDGAVILSGTTEEAGIQDAKNRSIRIEWQD